MCAAAGVDEMASIGGWMTSCPFAAARAPADERNERLMLMALEVIRDPQGTSELQLAGVWQLVSFCMQMRPTVCAAAVTAGLLEVAVSELHKSSPGEW